MPVRQSRSNGSRRFNSATVFEPWMNVEFGDGFRPRHCPWCRTASSFNSATVFEPWMNGVVDPTTGGDRRFNSATVFEPWKP